MFIPATPTTTFIANPYGAGTAEFISSKVCNSCHALAVPVGPLTNLCNLNTYPNPTSYVCSACVPNYIQYTWTAAGVGNAILDIDPF